MTDSIRDAVLDGWTKEDLFERQSMAADVTTLLVTRHQNALRQKVAPPSLVLNLDARYGAGKSFFLNAWADSLEKASAVVVRFNAWESDFSEEPLVAFTSELVEQLIVQDVAQTARKSINTFLDVTKRVAAPVLITAAARLLLGARLEDVEALRGAGDELSESAVDIVKGVADQLLEGHRAKASAIDSARTALAQAIEAMSQAGKTYGDNGLPVFVFIDELDRCRPNYAISLLESIKHIFQVPGVNFIIATDREQLAHSICAVYGNGFDGQFYLRRFFDRKISLPKPPNVYFSAELFNQRFSNNFPSRLSVPGDDPSTLVHAVNFFARLADAFDLPLRCQAQIADELEACVAVLEEGGKRAHMGFLMPALVLKNVSSLEYAYKALMGSSEILSTMESFKNYARAPVATARYYDIDRGVRQQTILLRDVLGFYESIRRERFPVIQEGAGDSWKEPIIRDIISDGDHSDYRAELDWMWRVVASCSVSTE